MEDLHLIYYEIVALHIAIWERNTLVPLLRSVFLRLQNKMKENYNKTYELDAPNVRKK